MLFKLTKTEAIQVATNAINASASMGLGVLHHENKEYTPEEIAECFDDEDNASFDYFHGRMVKLYLKKRDGVYSFNGEPNIEYQSWASKYPTYNDLVLSAL